MICLLSLDSLSFAKETFEYSFHLGAKQESIKVIISPRKKSVRRAKILPASEEQNKPTYSSDLGAGKDRGDKVV